MGGEGQEWEKMERHIQNSILELWSLLKDGGAIVNSRPNNNLQFIDSQPLNEVSGNYS